MKKLAMNWHIQMVEEDQTSKTLDNLEFKKEKCVFFCKAYLFLLLVVYDYRIFQCKLLEQLSSLKSFFHLNTQLESKSHPQKNEIQKLCCADRDEQMRNGWPFSGS